MPSQSPRSNKTRPVRQVKGPNKQQLRAAEVRAAQTHEDVFAAATPFLEESETSTEDEGIVVQPRARSSVRMSTTRSRGRASARPVVAVRKLTREQEYGFVKADLRRLLITAGSLAAVMVVLLFVIEM